MGARINIKHKRGDLFEKTFLIESEAADGTVTALNFTGKRVRMMIRADADDRVTSPLVDLGNDGGRSGITANSSGQIIISSPINIAAGTYDYDIEVSTGGSDPTTHIEGKFKVTSDATFA